MVLLLGLSAATTHAAPAVHIDTTLAGATPDGSVGASEYVGTSSGVGEGGFMMIGDPAGTAPITIGIDSDAAGNLFFGLLEPAGGTCGITGSDTVVIYLDADASAATGFANTTGFTDNGDLGRAAVSAMGTNAGPPRADLTFPTDFGAEYAIAFNGGAATLYELKAGVGHVAVTNPTVDASGCVIELSDVNLDDMGLAPGATFTWFATLLNASNAYRSNEFHGVTTPPSADIAVNPFTMADGDFNTFTTTRAVINEIDPNQGINDTAEFVEIRSVDTPMAVATGTVLVFYSETTGQVHAVVDVTGTTDAATLLQTGSLAAESIPDAGLTAYFVGSASEFSVGDPPALAPMERLIDTIAYNGAAALMLAFGVTVEHDENTHLAATTESINFCPTNAAPLTFEMATPTPGTANACTAYDYGDAPDSYTTLFASGGPEHALGSGIVLGASADGEADGQPPISPATAPTGDDTDGNDDDDGVVFAVPAAPAPTPYYAGNTSATVSVTTNGCGGVTCHLNGWIDFDNDGTFSAGEQIFINTVVTGTSTQTFMIPATTGAGDRVARFRLCDSTTSCNTVGGQAANGEVEDHVVTIVRLDLGDAAAAGGTPYPTLLANGGAAHIVGVAGAPVLGTTVDDDNDGQPSADADGDDMDADGDDEDGIVFPAAVVRGANTISYTITGGPGVLSLWADTNQNGVFETSERLLNDLAVAVGASTMQTITIPAGALAGVTHVRVRVCGATGSCNTPTGIANQGEVEDYQVEIAGLDYGDAPDTGSFPAGTMASYAYKTLAANNGARHVVTGLQFGASNTSETDGTSSATAAADAGDDGITFSAPLVAGDTAAPVTIALSGVTSDAIVFAWIDFNQDGTFDNGTEKIVANTGLTVTGNVITNHTFAIPSSALGGNTFARFRVTNASINDAQTPEGLASAGEVEDYQVTIVKCGDGVLAAPEVCDDGNTAAGDGCSATCTVETPNWTCTAVAGATSSCECASTYFGAMCTDRYDFGDASYLTTIAQGGPRHLLGGALRLGTLVDADADGAASPMADGDDAMGDDEDGVAFAASPRAGNNNAGVTVTVTGVNGLLNAWIDFNENGSFSDAGEQIFSDEAVSASANSLTFAIPATAAGGKTFARFRVSTAGGDNPTGTAADGEVEDYEIYIISCGDGVVDSPETCDDSNQASGDGCSSTCATETNWNCPAAGGACQCAPDQYGPMCANFCTPAANCSSQGTCDSNGDCTCNTDYFTSDCSVMCNPTTTCSGTGTCTAAGTCSCNANYYMADCSVFCDAATTCDGNGSCNTSTGACDCDANYFTSDCSEFCEPTTTCTAHGTCDSAGDCDCDTGYFTDDCSVFCDAATTCSGTGSCDGTTGLCDCAADYYTADCSVFCDAATTCDGNGSCTAAGTCSCDANYYGAGCTVFCDAGLTCNSNGTCDAATGACDCDPGFFGANCTSFCDDATTCSGNGVCNAGTGGCTCDPGFSGPDCTCGDGVRGPTEGCDDGDITPGDGCGATCLVESGFQCTEPAGGGISTCAAESDLLVTTVTPTPTSVYAGGNVTLAIDVENLSTVGDTGVTVSFPLPADTSFAGGANCALANPTTVECTLGGTSALTASGTATVSPILTVAASATITSITLTASVTGNQPDADLTNNATTGSFGVKFCGDGAVEAGVEGCDAGSNNDDTIPNRCRTDCSVPSCGDGVVDNGEQCDDGDGDNNDDCPDVAPLGTCQFATCGDGVIDMEGPVTDACDDGNSSDTDGCVTSPSGQCVLATCGDGHIRSTGANPELCDDGNAITTDDCPSGPAGTCRPSACGDGFVDMQGPNTEGCDDGNQSNADACPDGVGGSCQANSCGDGFVNRSVVNGRFAEDCDEGGILLPGDGCSASCRLEAGYTCDGQTQTVCTADCGTVHDFSAGDFGWVAGASGFAHGASTTFSATGWETRLSSSLPTVSITAVLQQTFVVPSANEAAEPTLQVSYALDGATGDCLSVIVGTSTNTATGTQVANTCTSTAGDTLAADLSAYAGQSLIVSLVFNSSASTSVRSGAFITEVALVSDADGDSLPEYLGRATCDPCVDADADGYGTAASNAPATCPNGSALDCDDTTTSVQPNTLELCTNGIDDNCDGDTDATDDYCFEDCGNFIDDGVGLTPGSPGDGLIDCAAASCSTGDPFCDTPCLYDWTFRSGPTFTVEPTSDNIFTHTGGSPGVWSTAGLVSTSREVGRIQLANVPFGTAADRGPEPKLLVSYALDADPVGRDVVGVCINNPQCDATSTTDFFELTDASTTLAVGTVDLTPYLGQAQLTITLVFDTIEAKTYPSVGGLQIFSVRLGSDVDSDGAFEGSLAACDRCWDADNDGYGSPSSPAGGLATCPVPNVVDCDDTTSQASPGSGTETVCGDGLDNDCNGLIDALDPSCGSEDCANMVDDNGDGAVDCDDVTCSADPACAVCATRFTLEKGNASTQTAAGWSVLTSSGPDLFQWGSTPSSFGGDGGYWTNIGANIDAGRSGNVSTWLRRTVTVPAGLSVPVFEMVYDMSGTADVSVSVCFDPGIESACTRAIPANVAWTSSASSPSTGTASSLVNQTYHDGTYDHALIPIPRGVVDVVVAFEATTGAGSALPSVPGLFITEMGVVSDADLDGIYENSDATCDHCVDRDGDGQGDATVIGADLTTCPQPHADCDDTDATVFLADFTPAGSAGTEACYVGGSTADNDCDGLTDPSDPDCRVCGNGTVEIGEGCDDGGTQPNDGCSATCQVEAGGFYLTELHLKSLFGNQAEQWFEVYNATQTPLSVTMSDLSFTNAAGQTVSFSSGCTALTTTTIAPGDFYIVALGPETDGDFADQTRVDAICTGFTLLDSGDLLDIKTNTGATLDKVDWRGADWGCITQNLQRVVGGQPKSRSLVLMNHPTATATQLNGTENDLAANWCLAGPTEFYSNTNNHFGSPGAEGGCGEILCDGSDDDCDLQVDEVTELADADGDGTCNERDCAPTEATCNSDCTSDFDSDGVTDCLDDCEDIDGDDYGVDGANGTCSLGQEPPQCDNAFGINPGVSEATPAECSDGIDNDCDGLRDCRDVTCQAQPVCDAELCATAQPVGCGFVTELVAVSDDFPVCNVGGVRVNSPTGPDQVFSFTAPTTGNVTLTIDNLGARRHELFVSTGASGCSETDCSAVTQIAGSSCANGGNMLLAVTQGETYSIVVKSMGGCNNGANIRARFAVSCAEVCNNGTDDDADGNADCADVECINEPTCLTADFDGDGVSNAFEALCGTDPLVATESPLDDAFLNPDGDSQLNCVDVDDDDDGASDVAELASCLDPESKNKSNEHPALDICTGAAPCGPAGQANCVTAGADGNCNGAVDTTEFLCSAIEDNCGDGLDDDSDGFVDCDDNQCVPTSFCAFDDFDNDGVPNGIELQCLTDPLSNLTTPTPAQADDPDSDGLANCSDVDDDGDGFDDVQEAICNSDPRDFAVRPPDLDNDLLCDDVDPDDDGDGFDDTTELNCGSDPRDNNNRPNDLVRDPDQDDLCNNIDDDDDGDGWSDFVESQCGTDPLLFASNPTINNQDVDNDMLCDILDLDDDGDTWPDTLENTCGTDTHDPIDVPIDTDGDTICDAVDGDDDGDGVPDAIEIRCNTSTVDATVLPAPVDQEDPDGDDLINCEDDDDDGDGLPDAAELIAGSDPLDPDSDSDGIPDGTEDANQDGVLDPEETSPTRADTDGDGLDDNIELASCYPTGAATCEPTLPYDSDTDGDGLSDGDEDRDLDGTLDADETSPIVADTDGDATDDGTEVQCDSDPLDSDSVPPDYDDDGVCDALQADTDFDGTPDGVEVYCGTDPLDNGSTPSLADLTDLDSDGILNCADADDDGDGFSDADEITCGTNHLSLPDRPVQVDVEDYDNDGLLNCVDTDDDGDGASDDDEELLGTNPLDMDSDDDGLADGQEVAINTNPLSPDTDNDGIQDGTEFGLVTGTDDTNTDIFVPDADPSTTTDPTNGDSDFDGVADGSEDTNGNGRIDDGEGDPSWPGDGREDTDGDGLTDRQEVTIYGTDPNDKDSDNDRLDDKLEVDVHQTDPNNPDTDGGGVIDGFEVATGNDPLSADDDFDAAQLSGDTVFGCQQGTSPNVPWLLLLALFVLLGRSSRRKERS